MRNLNHGAVNRRVFLDLCVAGAASAAIARGSEGRADLRSPIERLRKRVLGEVIAEGDAGYDAARGCWNLSVDQRPAVAVMAAGEADIAAAVSYAAERDLPVAVQGTGHGATVPADGGMLINTSRLRPVRIDPAARTATVAPGAKWADVIPRAHEYGLAPLSGSSSGVGVLGYTLGGGSGWLGRMYGFAADHVLSARVVTAGGKVVSADRQRNPDLFWALRGGTSNFGIVTELVFRLFPHKHVYGGGIYWPVERAREVASIYREFAAEAPESATTRFVLVQMPPLPSIPEALRGKWLAAVQGAFAGPEAEGARLFERFRRIGGAVEDALGTMPFTAADSIARDPKDPAPLMMNSEVVQEISPDLIRYLVEEVARPGARVAAIELRHQGGAFARTPEVPNAVGVRMRGFWFNAIAVTPPGAREGAERELIALRRDIRPWVTGSVFLNGIERFNAGRVRDSYVTETWDRLAQLKRRHDSRNLFRLNRNIPPVQA